MLRDIFILSEKFTGHYLYPVSASITIKKLTEHKKGGFNEFNCLYDEDWRSMIFGNLRNYGITEDQLSDLIVLIKACCNYEQDKRPKYVVIHLYTYLTSWPPMSL